MMHSWLWPDRTIGKRESRRLREEHNALVNKCSNLCDLILETLPGGIAPARFAQWQDDARKLLRALGCYESDEKLIAERLKAHQ